MILSSSRLFSLWKSWCDGFWLCVWFGLAFLLAFTIPIGVFGWLMRKAGKGGVFEILIGLLGCAFVVAASPVIMSKVFRELDFPWGREKSSKTQSAKPEPVMTEL